MIAGVTTRRPVVPVAMINAANRLTVIVRNPGGSYEAGMLATKTD